MRKVTARLMGILYLLLGGINLLAMLDSEIREQVISLGAVLFRYSGFVIVGIGLLMLRKWSAYVLAFVLGSNFVLVYTIYGGQTLELDGFMALLPWIGPVLIIVLFVYIWPVLDSRVQVGTASLNDGDGNGRD